MSSLAINLRHALARLLRPLLRPVLFLVSWLLIVTAGTLCFSSGAPIRFDEGVAFSSSFGVAVASSACVALLLSRPAANCPRGGALTRDLGCRSRRDRLLAFLAQSPARSRFLGSILVSRITLILRALHAALDEAFWSPRNDSGCGIWASGRGIDSHVPHSAAVGGGYYGWRPGCVRLRTGFPRCIKAAYELGGRGSPRPCECSKRTR